ncbi:hypothetical protein SAMN05443633_1314 [Chryseobacterium arachidis]|uniref:Uncharacterized protein n=1 Tax=Chryseobacterium arachidis TaxID=1416778 RepID=A0A1M5N176_9FLAO|nr:hypothetical protein [Chryseobacterium arachidis]SHG83291.1 hypothetical protein SAMN05443633_1314 [Chryseobacterium arachidis]
MKNKIFLLLLLLLIISFISNFYIEQKLNRTFSKISTESIKNLEYHSNKNFYENGIQNIGENLQKELITMDLGECRIKVRKDIFYFFQSKVVYVENDRRGIEIKSDYLVFNSMIKIKSFQNCKLKF